MSGVGPSPQVIKRGDTYVIHNMDPSSYSSIARVALAILIWPQVRALMESNGEYKERDAAKLGSSGIGATEDIDRVAANLAGAAWSRVNTLRPRLITRPDVIGKMLAGEFTSLHDVQRAIGMKMKARISEGATSNAKPNSKYYGKGDRFEDALLPLQRYLTAHEKRGFKYPHVAPRAAQKRIAVLDKVIADLVLVKEDLESRSHVATLRAPSEKRRKETS